MQLLRQLLRLPLLLDDDDDDDDEEEDEEDEEDDEEDDDETILEPCDCLRLFSWTPFSSSLSSSSSSAKSLSSLEDSPSISSSTTESSMPVSFFFSPAYRREPSIGCNEGFNL